MLSDAEARYALAIRALALATVLLAVTAVVEARTLRRARAELQVLRSERAATAAGIATSWTRQPADEIGRIVRWLDDFYREPAEGLGRADGLCAGGRVDDRAIAAVVGGAFLPSRAGGRSYEGAVIAVREYLVRTDEYRAVHPELAPAKGIGGR